jgi:hypothetical protein
MDTTEQNMTTEQQAKVKLHWSVTSEVADGMSAALTL